MIALGRDNLMDVELVDMPSYAGSPGQTSCSKVQDYPIFLETSAAVLLGDRVVMCGGGFGGSDTYSQCYSLDPASNEWDDNFRDLQLPRAFVGSAYVPDVGWWLLGGFQNLDGGIHVTSEFYDEANDVWEYGPNLPLPLYGHCAVQVNAST